MTREEVSSLCGEPDVIGSKGEYETWSYKLPSEDETAVSEVSLTFDSQGINTNISSQRRILNPAVAKVSISESYWKNRIEPKLDRGLLRQDEKYGIAILAKSGKWVVIIGGGHPPAAPFSEKGLHVHVADIGQQAKDGQPTKQAP